MLTFLKANAASLISSFFDYLVTIIAVQIFSINVVVASVGGNICGGVINFTLGRRWVFVARDENKVRQAGRYILVWIGYILLNSCGMYFLTKTNINYLVVKTVVSILVAFGYNYPLQKNFVFKTQSK
ncbi:MAG: GtrA family protein [Ginsengibacter sp.]